MKREWTKGIKSEEGRNNFFFFASITFHPPSIFAPTKATVLKSLLLLLSPNTIHLLGLSLTCCRVRKCLITVRWVWTGAHTYMLFCIQKALHLFSLWRLKTKEGMAFIITPILQMRKGRLSVGSREWHVQWVGILVWPLLFLLVSLKCDGENTEAINGILLGLLAIVLSTKVGWLLWGFFIFLFIFLPPLSPWAPKSPFPCNTQQTEPQHFWGSVYIPTAWEFLNHCLITFSFARKGSIIPRREGSKSSAPVKKRRTQPPSLRDDQKIYSSISPPPTLFLLLKPSSFHRAEDKAWTSHNKHLQFYQPRGRPLPLVLIPKFPKTLVQLKAMWPTT